MFTQALESMSKATGATVAMQRELFKKWIALWPGLLADPPAGAEQAERFRTRWSEAVSDLIKRQREVVEAQLKAGAQNIEKAFQVGEAKSPEELRAAAVELWRKCLDGLRQASEAQIRETHAAVEKWFDLVTSAVPSL